MIRMLALSPLVLPTRRRFVHRRGSLSPVRPATSSPRVDVGQDRSSLYPIGALASLFMLSVLPCLTVRTRARVRDVDTARGTAPPSRLRRPGLCPCRDCVAVLLAIAVEAEPPALTRANPVVAFPTASETKASRSRPPCLSTSLPRTSFRLDARASSQVSARVRPHVRTQANTPVCHRGARRHGQATFLPARSGEDMDAAFGRPMLTTAHASSPHSSEAKMRPSMCRGVRASLIEPRRPTLSAPG
jgi:hypothetical protein